MVRKDQSQREASGLQRSEVFEVRSAETELLHALPAAQSREQRDAKPQSCHCRHDEPRPLPAQARAARVQIHAKMRCLLAAAACSCLQVKAALPSKEDSGQQAQGSLSSESFCEPFHVESERPLLCSSPQGAVKSQRR